MGCKLTLDVTLVFQTCSATDYQSDLGQVTSHCASLPYLENGENGNYLSYKMLQDVQYRLALFISTVIYALEREVQGFCLFPMKLVAEGSVACCKAQFHYSSHLLSKAEHQAKRESSFSPSRCIRSLLHKTTVGQGSWYRNALYGSGYNAL